MIGKDIIPDGSDRSFSRIKWQGRDAVEIVPAPGRQGLMEARSFFLIGSHLASRGVPVPVIYQYDDQTGRVVVEDLGDIRLQDIAVSHMRMRDFRVLSDLYMRVLDILIMMESEGADGFDTGWCWQEPVYNAQVAYKREALYFFDSFLKDYLGLDTPLNVLEQELTDLTDRVSSLDCTGSFLHRDFQSRNMMFKMDRIKIIDFQAARLGPICYDAASLIHDPYVGLPWPLRQELFAYYLERVMNRYPCISGGRLEVQWHLLSILRMMQALGAFGFLLVRKRRSFFKDFIRTALDTLLRLLESWDHTGVARLVEQTRLAIQRIDPS